LWWKTSLAWMSIGYETQLPPIATLTFYNAIANDGKMVKPRFVTAVKKNGEVLYEYPVEVLKERICSPSTLADIREILEMVVSKGLGKKAGCKDFKVSGKTGTAQVAQKGGGYKSGRTKYLISFCGFYPSEQPKYSCIVAIQKTGLPASGGGHCGPVFSEIAQSVMAKGVYRDVSEAYDSTSVFVPDVLYGNMNAAQYVLEELDIPYRSNQDESSSVWGVTENNGNAVKFTVDDTPMDVVPDVRGMGAKDAVYALESRGLKVTLEGMGKVVGQSIAPDSDFQEGETIHIRLK
ncbi:MAG: PASTA domain-containing protein, partial [Paraprevotella sp.]|nr:PASTA domain-containing protein [Paraprevotella sp.]